MPSLATPRIVTGLIVKPPGNTAPGSAQGTFRPAATLGAPQTIVFDAPPTSTSQTDSLSALG